MAEVLLYKLNSIIHRSSKRMSFLLMQLTMKLISISFKRVCSRINQVIVKQHVKLIIKLKIGKNFVFKSNRQKNNHSSPKI